MSHQTSACWTVRLLGTALALAILTVGSIAWAGPNAGGTLILHANPSIVYCSDASSYCGQSGLAACDGAHHVPV